MDLEKLRIKPCANRFVLEYLKMKSAYSPKVQEMEPEVSAGTEKCYFCVKTNVPCAGTHQNNSFQTSPQKPIMISEDTIKLMSECLKMAKLSIACNGEGIGSLVVNPVQKIILGSGMDDRRHHPYRHSIFVLIDSFIHRKGTNHYFWKDAEAYKAAKAIVRDMKTFSGLPDEWVEFDKPLYRYDRNLTCLDVCFADGSVVNQNYALSFDVLSGLENKATQIVEKANNYELVSDDEDTEVQVIKEIAPPHQQQVESWTDLIEPIGGKVGTMKNLDGALRNIEGLFSGLDVYVTREPCVVCSLALHHVKARRVCYGTPHPSRGGLGTHAYTHLFTNSEMVVEGDVLRERCEEIIGRRYLNSKN